MMAQPDEIVFGANGPPDGATVLNFWRWCFSDVCDDDIKGWFAEWIVGKLLGLPMSRRISWAASDHVTAEGVRIEVKATAHWQSWKIINEDGTAKIVEALPDGDISRIGFGSLRSRNVRIPTHLGQAFRFNFGHRFRREVGH